MTAQTSLVARIALTLTIALGGTGTLFYAVADGASLSLSRTPAVAAPSSSSNWLDAIEAHAAPGRMVACAARDTFC